MLGNIDIVRHVESIVDAFVADTKPTPSHETVVRKVGLLITNVLINLNNIAEKK